VRHLPLDETSKHGNESSVTITGGEFL